MQKAKLKKVKEKERNHSGAEKPVSLWGASFTEVLAALLKTRPMPKGSRDGRHEETSGGAAQDRS